MAEATHGLGGLKYDPAKRTRAPEWNVFGALVLIVLIFEILNRMQGGAFLFNMRDNVDAIFNQQRLDIMILQVAIIGVGLVRLTQCELASIHKRPRNVVAPDVVYDLRLAVRTRADRA